jgi:DnaJ-domain-containing protein 1
MEMFELREQAEDVDDQNLEALSSMIKEVSDKIVEQGGNIQKYLDDKLFEKAAKAAVKLKYLSKVCGPSLNFLISPMNFLHLC